MLFRPDRRMTLQKFKPRRGNAQARAAAIQLAGREHACWPAVLVVAGPPACGKSHLLHAASRLAWQTHNHAPCSVLAARQLADQVARGESFGDLGCLARQLQTDQWLAIDDVDRLPAWPTAANFLLSVLLERQKKHRPSLLTATLGLVPDIEGELLGDSAGQFASWLDQQPAVLLLRD